MVMKYSVTFPLFNFINSDRFLLVLNDVANKFTPRRDVTNRLGNVAVSLSTFSSAFNQRKGIDLEKSGSNFKLRYIEIIVVKDITQSNRIYIINWIYFNRVTRESWTLNAERENFSHAVS